MENYAARKNSPGRTWLTKPVFSGESFTTISAYEGFVTKSQLLETLFTRNLLTKVGRIQRAV